AHGRPARATSCSSHRTFLIRALPFCHARLQAQKPLASAYLRELKTLADRLRKRRLDLGLRQRDVAERLGVDPMTVNNWERHHTQPGRQLTLRILHLLDKDP